MSFRVQAGRSFPDNINMSGIKQVSPELLKAMEALLIAKLSTQGSTSEVAGMYNALASNGNLQTRVEDLEAAIKAVERSNP